MIRRCKWCRKRIRYSSKLCIWLTVDPHDRQCTEGKLHTPTRFIT